MIEFRKIFEQRKGQFAQLSQEQENLKIKIKEAQRKSHYYEEAQMIIQTVAQLTQQELEYHINELVSLAMAAVFDDPYELSVKFVLRAGRTEADLHYIRDGHESDPMLEDSGGSVDVGAFALRVAAWCLAPQRTRNVLILDEPLTALKGDDLPEKGAMMIKEISDKLKLQIIMVSHIPDQIKGADKIIEIKKIKGISTYKGE